MPRTRLLQALALALAGTIPATAADDVTFLLVADPHVPHALDETREVLAQLPPDAPLRLAPYEVDVPPPSFAVVVGDLNEFSGGAGWWEQYMGLWADIDLPVYHQLGNHDNTWECARPRLRQVHDDAFYAFERAGVTFIGWDTATPQDPRPSIATEGLRWLESELARIPRNRPIVLFFHHTFDGREYAGDWERARLLDALSGHNLQLMLVGHGHSVRAWQVEGIDTVMGGSTFGERRGYGIVSIADGALRVCFQHIAPEPQMVPVLERPLVEEQPGLYIAATDPPDGAVLAAADEHAWRLQVHARDPVQRGRWLLDGEERAGPVVPGEDGWIAPVNLPGVDSGAHVLRFELLDEAGRIASRTISFWLDTGDTRIEWLHRLPGSCQSTPALLDGRVIVGSNDGSLSALDAATGEEAWRVQFDGEVRASPSVDAELHCVYVAAADGTLAAVGADGAIRWRHDLRAPTYASPVLAGERVICGTSDGAVVSVDRRTGEPAWRCEAPEYAIESAVAVDDAGVYAGCWDRYLYAIERADGTMRWRAPSAGSDRDGFVARYYAPADCAPALVGGRLFAADRAYRLTVFDPLTGERVADEERCVALCAAGDHAYLRHTDGRMSRRTADNEVVWEAEVPTGAIAAAPTVAGGRVWVVSNAGTLSAIDDATGEVLGSYRAFTDSFVFASPAYDGERAYVADAAGRVLALRMSRDADAEGAEMIEDAPLYDDHTDLMYYLDDHGQRHEVQTPDDWRIRRRHILANMQRVMGEHPSLPTVPLDMQAEERVEGDGWTRRRITFVAEEGDRVPAWLCVPEGLTDPAPAMLCLHQSTEIGKDEPIGLGGKPNLRYALELAERGFVTLAPDYPGYGDYHIDAYAMGYASATMKGIVNHRRAVDLLQSLDEVDPKRIGVIGHSLGGHNSLFVAAFDERLRVAVSSCGFNAFAHYKRGDLSGWSHDGYMPRIRKVHDTDPARMPFDFHEVLGSIAPRHVFVNAPTRDANFLTGVQECIDAARGVYDLHDAAGRLVIVRPDCEHDFPPEVREQAYEFIERALD